MTDELLRQAIELVKQGKKKSGGEILVEILRKEPKNETAWIWLAACYSDPEKTKKCLKRTLEINPDNHIAQKALASLEPVESPSLSMFSANTNNKENIEINFIEPEEEKNLRKTTKKRIIASIVGIAGVLFILIMISVLTKTNPLKEIIPPLEPCNEEFLQRFLTTQVNGPRIYYDMESMNMFMAFFGPGNAKWRINRKNPMGCSITMEVEQNGEYIDSFQYYVYLDSGRIMPDNDLTSYWFTTMRKFCDGTGCLDEKLIIRSDLTSPTPTPYPSLDQ